MGELWRIRAAPASVRRQDPTQPGGDVADLGAADLVLHRVLPPLDGVAERDQQVARALPELDGQNRIEESVAHEDRDIPVRGRGFRLDLVSTKSRFWSWDDAHSWFVLSDMRESISSGVLSNDSAPFELTKASFRPIHLTEPAGLALLQAAKSAGRSLVKKRQRLPGTQIIATVYTDAGSIYARLGDWEPA